MLLTDFKEGDVIHKTKPREISGGIMFSLGKNFDRSFIEEPMIFISRKQNLILLKYADKNNDYTTKVDIDTYNEDWDFYPVFAEEKKKYKNLKVSKDGERYEVK